MGIGLKFSAYAKKNNYGYVLVLFFLTFPIIFNRLEATLVKMKDLSTSKKISQSIILMGIGNIMQMAGIFQIITNIDFERSIDPSVFRFGVLLVLFGIDFFLSARFMWTTCSIQNWKGYPTTLMFGFTFFSLLHRIMISLIFSDLYFIDFIMVTVFVGISSLCFGLFLLSLNNLTIPYVNTVLLSILGIFNLSGGALMFAVLPEISSISILLNFILVFKILLLPLISAFAFIGFGFYSLRKIKKLENYELNDWPQGQEY